MLNIKKLLTLSSIGLIAVGLSGCSVAGNLHHDTRNNNYTYIPKAQTLHKPIVVKTFSENYYDASGDKSANQNLDNKVNGYLSHIKNIKDYQESTRSTSVSDDGDENGGQVIVDTVTLTKK